MISTAISGWDVGPKLVKALHLEGFATTKIIITCGLDDAVRVDIEYFLPHDQVEDVVNVLSEYAVKDVSDVTYCEDGWKRFELVKKV